MTIRKLQALHNHWTWKHGSMKPKTAFDTADDAVEFMARHNIKGYHPYICPDCNMWHIGHNKN